MRSESSTVGIVPGEGLVARFGGVAVFLATANAATDRILGAVRAAAEGERPGPAIAQRLAAVVFAGGAEPPPFGVVAPTPDGTLVLLRGSVSAQLHGAEGVRTLSGERAFTWVDEIVRDPVRSVSVGAGNVFPLTAVPHTDLRDGVVPGGGFVLRVALRKAGRKSVARRPKADAVEPAPARPALPVAAEPPATRAEPAVPASGEQAEPPPTQASGFTAMPEPTGPQDLVPRADAPAGGAAPSGPEPTGHLPAPTRGTPAPSPATGPATGHGAGADGRATARAEGGPATTHAAEEGSQATGTGGPAAAHAPAEGPATAHAAASGEPAPGDPPPTGHAAPHQPGPCDADPTAKAPPRPDPPRPLAWSQVPDAPATFGQFAPPTGTAPPTGAAPPTGTAHGAAHPRPRAGQSPGRDARGRIALRKVPNHGTRIMPPVPPETGPGALVLDGTAYPLDRPYVIGRGPQSDAAVQAAVAAPLVLPRDRHVSRVHAYVSIDNGAVFVRDAGTGAGTFVAPPGTDEWARIGTDPTELPPGGRVRISDRVLTYLPDPPR